MRFLVEERLLRGKEKISDTSEHLERDHYLGSLVIWRVPLPTWAANGITVNSDASGRLERDHHK